MKGWGTRIFVGCKSKKFCRSTWIPEQVQASFAPAAAAVAFVPSSAGYFAGGTAEHLRSTGRTAAGS